MAIAHPKPGPEGAGAAGGLPHGPDHSLHNGHSHHDGHRHQDGDRHDARHHDEPARLPISRITARRDFLAANAGVRVPATAFILLVQPTALGETRAGFTVSKKVGNAVARNRARRRLREATRIAMPEAAVPGADHIFIARRMDAERPFEDLVRDTRHALAKARRKLAGNR